MIKKIVFLDDIERWEVDKTKKEQVESWRLLLQNIVKIVRKLSNNEESIADYDAIDIVSYYGKKKGDNNEKNRKNNRNYFHNTYRNGTSIFLY